MHYTKAQRERLQLRIREVCDFLAMPPFYVRDRFGELSGEAGLVATLGSDIEFRVTHDGKLLRPEKSKDHVNKLILSANKQLARERLLWHWDKINEILQAPKESSREPVMLDTVGIDGDRIECRTHPALAPQSAQIIDETIRRFDEICQDHGCESEWTSGHLHISFKILKGVKIWDDENNSSVYNPNTDVNSNNLFKAIISGMIDFQETYPALFLRPRNVERNGDIGGYAGTEYLRYSENGHCSASVVQKSHEDEIFDVIQGLEARIAKISALHSVALYMTAIEHGIKNGGKSLLTGQPHRLMFGKKGEAPHRDDDMGHFENTFRGKNGFLDLIKVTVQNLSHDHPDIKKALSPDLQIDLIKAVCRDYRQYLDSTIGRKRYREREAREIKRELAEIEKKFTAEKALEADEISEQAKFHTSMHPGCDT